MSESQHQAILQALTKGEIGRAESLCEAFLRSGGGAEGLYLMGAIQSLKGDKAAALRLIGRAAALLPERADIAYNHGVALRETGQTAAAAGEWRRTLALDPEHRDASANLALALDQLGDGAGTVAAYAALLERWPDDRDGLYNFANFRQRADDYSAARDLYAKLTEKHPDFAAGWINRAMLLKRSRDWDGAERCYRRAIEADPGSAQAHFNLGNLLLARGRWREGFAEYEWRLTLAGYAHPEWRVPEWNGSEPAGTRVILWGDQGYGDAIHFLRFAAAVAGRGHRVYAVVKTELRSLAATAPGVEAAYGPADDIPAADAQVSLASLPHRLAIDDPARFWIGPYLRAPESGRPVEGAGLKVGLAWAGDPRHPNDAHRSVRLEELAPLLEVPGASWFALQLGAARERLAASPFAGRIVDLAPAMADFAASAAIVNGLDLVVTVDTSMAHLVGALGRPGIVLLPHIDCDWRWRDEGDATPWYPTLRLFRQDRPRGWPAVAAAVAREIAARAR